MKWKGFLFGYYLTYLHSTPALPIPTTNIPHCGKDFRPGPPALGPRPCWLIPKAFVKMAMVYHCVMLGSTHLNPDRLSNLWDSTEYLLGHMGQVATTFQIYLITLTLF